MTSYERILTPLDREELARARRAAAGTPRPQTGMPMGIRYKTGPTPAPAPLPAAKDTGRPGWAITLAATPSAVLEQLGTGSRTHRVPRTRPRTAAAVPAPRTTPPAAPARAEAAVVAAAVVAVPEARVLRRTDAYACLQCGARYTHRADHGCGRLTPVTVTITARTSTPPSTAVARYDTFGCWTCRVTNAGGDADHDCGPLTPVTVTITRRTTGSRP
jgi:hypothetical protein